MKLFEFQATAQNDRGTYQTKLICDHYDTFVYKLQSFSLYKGWKYWQTKEQEKANQSAPEVKYRLTEDSDIVNTKTAYYDSHHFFIVPLSR
jgi:phage/plasmid-associated DNA primase